MGTKFTSLRPDLFNWAPYYRLSAIARQCWLGIYASAEAKAWLPGLVRMSVPVLADAVRIGTMDAMSGMRELVDTAAAVVDDDYRIIRLTALPDKGERPHNGNALRGFWTTWQRLPPSPLKYDWLDTLWWLVNPLTKDHNKVWSATFGSVEAPEPKPQATPVPETAQIGLFEQNFDKGSDSNQVVIPWRMDGSSHAASTGIGSGTGSGTGSGIRESNGRANDRSPPTMNLYDVLETLATTSGGRVDAEVSDSRLGHRLWDTVYECDSQGVTLDDIALAGEFLAAGYLDYRNDLGCRWVASPGNLLDTVTAARKWDSAGRPALGKRRSARSQGAGVGDIVARAQAIEAKGR